MVPNMIFGDKKASYPLFPGAEKWRNCRIGLLGGSFNPAHEGHLHISLEALKRLQLDAVWWLVTPGNPLKDPRETKSIEKRIASAKALAQHPRIVVSDIERRMGTRYTVDTLLELRTICPQTKFTWLMGADCMAQFDQWKDWQFMCNLLPIAIFDREGYSSGAMRSRLARQYGRWRVSANKAASLPDAGAPGWCFIPCPRNPATATAIRASGAW